MLMQTDPLLGLDRFTLQPWTTPALSAREPMDTSAEGKQIVVEFDWPAIATDSGDAGDARAA